GALMGDMELGCTVCKSSGWYEFGDLYNSQGQGRCTIIAYHMNDESTCPLGRGNYFYLACQGYSYAFVPLRPEFGGGGYFGVGDLDSKSVPPDLPIL
ncbi:hypothetical protein Ancab_004315, partial [Ancistrocladus abbreviatus]